MEDLKYPSFKILLVDDEIYALQSCEIALRSEGMDNIITCQDSREVMTVLSEHDVGLVLLDLTMPNVSGEELLSMIPPKYPDILVVVVTAVNELETAVNCMRSGAFDYLLKPLKKNALVAVVKRAINILELKKENQLLKSHVLSGKLENPDMFAGIITANKNMLSIFHYIESIAPTSQPVLITGETGAGKELVARAVHNLSKREGQFVAVNAGGLDDEVFSDTLFGHVKGSFTGALESRKGLIETAFGGTLFLDEIGDLNNASQVKLLRLLQENEYFQIGSDTTRRSRARIIVATNMDVESLKNSDRFRKDLYYRLRSHHVNLPPLRERLDDLPALLDYFLEKAAEKLGKKKPTAPSELLTLLSTYDFQGNIRELEAMVFDAVSNHKSKKLSMDVFSAWIFKDNQSGQKNNGAQNGANEADESDGNAPIIFPAKLPTLKETALMLVNEALARAGGNQNIAAKQLGISRQALNKRLQPDKSE